MAQIESFIVQSREWIFENRRALFWIFVSIFVVWLLAAAEEITVLLLVSYFIAVLIDPAVSSLERRKWSRSPAVIVIGLLITFVILLILLLLIPSIAEQYTILIHQLPDYVDRLVFKVTELLKQLGVAVPSDSQAFSSRVREWVKALRSEQIRSVVEQAYNAVLSGYSFTLMAFNIFLVPFFVYYISVELRTVHRTILGLFRPSSAERISEIASEIMVHVYAFFRGQVTVGICLAVLYSTGLVFVGLPSGLAIGMIAGVLGIIPYLGIFIGVALSTIITLVTDPSISQLLMVWGVFAFVQLLDGFFITPRVVGEKMGLHPLEVMLSLLLGGKLFGLVGLLLAIPAVAAVRVLFRHVRSEVEDDPLSQIVVASS